jgi:N-acyl homoserine lactone hydrolase
MRTCAFLLIAAVLGTACSGGGAEGNEAVRLYVFDCGHLRVDTVQPFGIDDDETDVRELAVPCYVIEHPRGRLLWDAGLPSSLAAGDGWQALDDGEQVRFERPLADQLAELGLDMNSFDYVAFSHMHFDHVGAANEIEHGTLIIQRAEHDAAFADEVTVIGFEPRLYTGLEGLDKRVIDGDHDVFGDGRVRIVAAPGHTPGHQVLFVDLAEHGPVVLSGDLYHFRISREQQRIPVFNVDPEQTLESMARVEALVAETGADFWIQHEAAHFETLRLAPAYYR